MNENRTFLVGGLVDVTLDEDDEDMGAFLGYFWSTLISDSDESPTTEEGRRMPLTVIWDGLSSLRRMGGTLRLIMQSSIV